MNLPRNVKSLLRDSIDSVGHAVLGHVNSRAIARGLHQITDPISDHVWALFYHQVRVCVLDTIYGPETGVDGTEKQRRDL